MTDVKHGLVTYLIATGWQPPTKSGPQGALWRNPEYRFAVPVPESLDDEGPDWELILDRLALVEKSTPRDVERRIRRKGGLMNATISLKDLSQARLSEAYEKRTHITARTEYYNPNHPLVGMCGTVFVPDPIEPALDAYPLCRGCLEAEVSLLWKIADDAAVRAAEFEQALQEMKSR